ncbi:MAG: hypothetical protein A2583_02600 [Bdellovibrionales bacterium RIFOXYD1_FULL_53_11]|nr:MAG: hypothetical protein A2583_02600 [Bdellovibrionales bacterium RIFOXYD1_FULL_53_11]
MIKLLHDEARRFIGIKSISSDGNEELANHVISLMHGRGMKTILQHVMHSLDGVTKRQFNAIGILGDPLVDKKTRKGILLVSHLDTCSPGISSNWGGGAGDPFLATTRQGSIYGLGVADAKLDFLCKLHAIEKMRERKLRMPVYLVGTCGKELGMFGSRYLIKSLVLNPKHIVVGDPTGLKTVYAHRSMCVMRVSVGYQLVTRDAKGFNRRIDLHSYGKGTHSADPSLGINAIEQILKFLSVTVDSGFDVRFTSLAGGDLWNKVPDYAKAEFYLTSHQFEDFKRFFKETVQSCGGESAFRVDFGGLGDMGVRFLPDAVFSCVSNVVAFFSNMAEGFRGASDDGFVPPHSTVNFSRLQLKQGCVELYFDFRLSGRQIEELDKQIQLGIKSIASRYSSLNVSSAMELATPGLETTPKQDLPRLCGEAMAAAGIEPGFSKIAAESEAALYSMAGYDAVSFGPGALLGNSRSPDEHIQVDQLEKAALFYEKLIERTCL